MSNRISIPRAIAEEVLYMSDATCVKCHVSGRRVRIHHIDEDPSNNRGENLESAGFRAPPD
jgi:hypothetical protein